MYVSVPITIAQKHPSHWKMLAFSDLSVHGQQER